MISNSLWPVAIAIVIAAAIFCATIYALGREWIRSQRVDDDEPARAGKTADEADEAEEDDEDEVEAQVAAFINSVRAGNHDAMMLEAWREEKRAEGLTDEEIDRILANRPTILVT